MAIKESGLIGRQDKLLSFGSTGSVSATGDALCGKTASADAVALDMNQGDLEGMAVHFDVLTALNGTGTVTGAFFIEVSSDGSNWTKIATTPAIGKADLTAEKGINVPFPRGYKDGRYIRAGVTLAGTSITAGEFTACVDTFAGV